MKSPTNLMESHMERIIKFCLLNLANFKIEHV